MKKIVLILGLFLGISFCGIAQKPEQENRDYIEVYGTAVMEIVPDEIYVKIILKEKEQRGKSELEQREKSLISMLEKNGIEVKKDLALRDMSGNRYKLKSGTMKLKKEYILLLHDIKTLDRVFSGLETLGDVDAEVERVDHSRIEQYRLDVKIDAIKIAKAKAEALAAAIGQSVKEAIYIGEERWGGFASQISNIAMNAGRDNDDGGMEFEKITLQGTVQVRFKLWDK